MKTFEIIGGWAHSCNCCGEGDGTPTLYWEKEDFDLCYSCLTRLYKEAVEGGYIPNEEIFLHKPIIHRLIISEKIRNEIFQRDKYKCIICGSTQNLEIDHIIPFSKGGKTEMKNLQTLCKSCNKKKKDKTKL